MSGERYTLWLGIPFGAPTSAFNIVLCITVLL